jgi:hypothetical protein
MVTFCPAVPGDYRPSNELLATFATLPAQFLNQGADQNTNHLKQEETRK